MAVMAIVRWSSKTTEKTLGTFDATLSHVLGARSLQGIPQVLLAVYHRNTMVCVAGDRGLVLNFRIVLPSVGLNPGSNSIKL